MTFGIGQDSDRVPRVVVGVDGSPDSVRALAWAAAEARLRGAVLHVVHVDFFRHGALEALAPRLLGEEKAVLDRAVGQARALEPGIEVRGRICEPPAAKSLIEASEDAEMLVVGSRGLTGLRELTMGSVSNECAHHGRCPVVIVRPLASPVSTESSESMSNRLSAAEEEAAASGSGCAS